MTLKDDYHEDELLAANARLDAFHAQENDDDDDYPFEEDDWEDTKAIAAERAKYPGWMFMKITGYGPDRFKRIEKWCEENCQSDFAKVGWTSGCSYTVAVAFRDYRDALMYKLVFQG